MIGQSFAHDEPRRSRVDLITTVSIWQLACDRLDIDLLVKHASCLCFRNVTK